MSDGPYERSGMSDRPVSDRPMNDHPIIESSHELVLKSNHSIWRTTL